ncbi:MAG: hypothetical protein Q9162_006233 [Coniocarpon cinnabarinum]
MARTQQRRAASTAAAEARSDDHDPENDSFPPSTPSEPSSNPATAPITGPKPFYSLNCSVILSRPPILTRDLHPFESAYFLYQKRLNERTAMPFTRYFYYKKGTPADLEWKRKARERLTPARDIGNYHAYGKEAWNDELLVGAQESSRDHQMQMLLRDAESAAEDPATGGEQGKETTSGGAGPGSVYTRRKKIEIEKPQDRLSEADQDGDTRSLNRLMTRALYFVVRNEDGRWTFPTSSLEGREWLRKGANRIIEQAGGMNMNTWLVGHVPIGHFVQDYYKPHEEKQEDTIQLGQKTFFMKGRIMAGQADLGANQLALTDFKWLTKEEIRQLVSPKYWSMTEDMLTER